MKLNYQLFWLRMFLLFAVSLCMDADAQEYSEITFSDTFQSGSSSNFNAPALNKAQRVKRNASSIVVSGEDNIEDDEVMKVLEYVLSVWEAHILNAPDIFINVKIDDIVSDIETTVRYEHRNKIAYPTALIGYIEGRITDKQAPPDGIIVINRETDWDYAIGDNIDPSKKNLAFGLMRAIARVLGFGSDVVADANGNYFFSEKRNHTIFNTLVSNSLGKKLSDIPINGGRPSIELKSFVEEPKQTFQVNTKNNNYKLASPPYSLDCPPFIYIEDRQSLMRKDISIGDHFLKIDEVTQDILKTIGWNTQSPLVEIISDEVPETGLASAYESHRFKLKTPEDLTVNEEKWHLELPLGNGQFEYVTLKSNGHYWYTEPIDNVDKYKRNIDGDIEAKICCTCIINGNIVELLPYNIRFELQPLIAYAFIDRIENEYPKPSYNAYYKVKYYGADHVRVYVEEEYRSEIKLTYINEPFMACGCATHVTAPFRAWIDFVVENKYGKSTYTISLLPNGEIEPQGLQKNNEHRKDMTRTDLNVLKSISGPMQVYDAYGNSISKITNLNELDNISYKGLIIIRSQGTDGNLNILKTLLK